MNIVYALTIIAAFISGFFVAIKSVQLGLKWQMQTANKQEPKLHNPIDTVVNAVQQKQTDKVNKYTEEQVNEWMYGAGGK